MTANVFKKNAKRPQDTTQDQINEMESEGQAMTQDEKSRPSPRRTNATGVRGEKAEEQRGA
jgi:hypothetical protein